MKHLVWFALLGLAACNQGNTQFVAGTQVVTVGFQVVSPSEGGATRDARPEVRWTAAEGATRYRVSFYGNGSLTELLDFRTTSDTSIRPNVSFADGQKVYVEVTTEDGRSSGVSRFKVVMVPDEFPRFDLQVNEPLAWDGYRLFTLIERVPADIRTPAMVLVNRAGEIVWHYVHPALGTLTAPAISRDGNLLFLYRRPINGGPVTAGTGYEMTWDGRFLWESRPDIVLHHELGHGPGGNMLYLTWVFEEVDGIDYEGDGIELVDPATNAVLWSWNIFDHYRPEDIVVPEAERQGISGLGRDWSHSNAVVWDEERSVFWMSVRHFDIVIGIDYPSGAVKYTLGDGMVSHTHAPEVQADGSIMLFDNGNGFDPPESTVKIFDLDDATGVFTLRFRWGDDPPRYDFAVGDANRLPNGNILATFGVNADIVEITPSGEKVWELCVSDNGSHWIYRTVHVPRDVIPPGVLPFDD